MTGYVYLFLTIALTIYGQLAIKFQVSHMGALPAGFGPKLVFMTGLVFTPWVFSGLLAAFLASLCWMAALTKFPLTHAYPFMSLTFVGTLVLGSILFLEPLNTAKWLGLGLLVTGLVVSVQNW